MGTKINHRDQTLSKWVLLQGKSIIENINSMLAICCCICVFFKWAKLLGTSYSACSLNDTSQILPKCLAALSGPLSVTHLLLLTVRLCWTLQSCWSNLTPVSPLPSWPKLKLHLPAPPKTKWSNLHFLWRTHSETGLVGTSWSCSPYNYSLSESGGRHLSNDSAKSWWLVQCQVCDLHVRLMMDGISSHACPKL